MNTSWETVIPPVLAKLPTFEHLKRWTTQEYFHIFTSEEADAPQVELLLGHIYRKAPKTPLPSSTSSLLGRNLSIKFREAFLVRQGSPIEMTNLSSVPEPDVVLCERKSYEHRYPSPTEVSLTVEVAETSIVIDETLKLPIYAAAGIPEYWMVNLKAKRLAIYWEPDVQRASYQHQRIHQWGTPIHSPLLGEQEWDEFFGL